MSPVGDKGADSEQPFRQQEFDNILNFRDVGETVNGFLGRKLVREGVLFRSARLDDATPEEQRRLRDDVGVKTIIDLRTKTEHINAAKKRQAALADRSGATVAAAESLQIPGVKYLQIKVTGRNFEKFLLRQLSWWNFLKVLFLFLLGLRLRAIAILSREVMVPRGLVGLGLAVLDESGEEIDQALSSLLEPGTLPLLVHCTQGKDRTGLIVILVLMILGVSLDTINYDYQLSSEALASEKESLLTEIKSVGLTSHFGGTAPDLVQKAAEHLEDRYGGLDGYLDGIGFGQVKRDKLREILLY